MLTGGQAAVSGTAPVAAFRVPPGPGWVYINNSSGTAYIGPGTNLALNNGFIIPSGGFCQFQLYQGGGGGTMYVAGTATVSWMISAASAQTGP